MQKYEVYKDNAGGFHVKSPGGAIILSTAYEDAAERAARAMTTMEQVDFVTPINDMLFLLDEIQRIVKIPKGKLLYSNSLQDVPMQLRKLRGDLSRGKLLRYDTKLPEYGDLMTLEDFKRNVRGGLFIDYDGHGHPAMKIDGTFYMDQMFIVSPSRVDDLPPTVTHVMWFNR